MDTVLKSDEAQIKNGKTFQYAQAVRVWLFIGLVMIFVQVVVGGITRLTGSGLSITKWEIVTGTLPPLNAAQWEEAFDLYKDTPQYEKINQGMSLGKFKFIYFWEYIHRLWARLMGFVFFIPFVIFWSKGMFDKMLKQRLIVVFLLAALVASFGWIMVASGLVNRPWVNAYKLTMHLSLAMILYSYLLWTYFKTFPISKKVIHNSLLKRLKMLSTTFLMVLAVQLVLGGIMSGMKAALFYPTWPSMNGEFIPSELLTSEQWNTENFIHYDATPFMSALIQFMHRSTAYILIIIGLYLFFQLLKIKDSQLFKNKSYMLISMLIIQVLLGVFTLLNAKGIIPVGLGVAHQAGALLLLSIALSTHYQLVKRVG